MPALTMRRRDVHFFDVLLGVFQAYLWALCGDLRFADARPDVVHPVVSLRSCSLLPPRCLSSDNLLYLNTGSYQKIELKLPENVKTA